MFYVFSGPPDLLSPHHCCLKKKKKKSFIVRKVMLCFVTPKLKNKNVSSLKACTIKFLRKTMCALHPCFAINAPENYCPPLPAQQRGQTDRKLLSAAWRDKAGDIKTSVLACGIVQPAWITLLYTWEYNT